MSRLSRQISKWLRKTCREQARSRLRAIGHLSELLDTRLLLTVTPSASVDGDTLNIGFDIGYEIGQSVFDLDDIYLRKSAYGNIQWSTSEGSGYADAFDQDLSAISSINIIVRQEAKSDADFSQLTQNLFQSSISTLFVGDFLAPGKNVSLTALDIDVQTGKTISTRTVAGLTAADHQTGISTGDSGHLSLSAPLIHLETGAQLLAHSGATFYSAGNISLTANGTLEDISSSLISLPILPADISTARSKILLESATIRGRDVTLKASADASDLFSDQDAEGGFGGAESFQEYLGAISLSAGVAVSASTAEVVVDGGSIEGRDLTFSSSTETDAKSTVLTTYGAIAYGQSSPQSVIDIRNAAQLTAANQVQATTFADSRMDIQATQNLAGTSNISEKKNITLAGGYSDVVSKVSFGSNTSVSTGADLIVDVGATRDHSVLSNAAAYGDGTLATAINVAVHKSTLSAFLDGRVTVGGNLKTTADLATTRNDYAATSTVGTGNLSSSFFGSKLVDRAKVVGWVTNAFNSLFSTNSAVDPSKQSAQEKGVAAAINAGFSINHLDVRIGPNATANVGTDVILAGSVKDEPELSAVSYLNSNRPDSGYATKGSLSQREKGTAAAITGGYIENDVNVYIGSNATVSAGGDILVRADASVPYDIPDGKAGWLKRFFDTNNLGMSTF